METLTALLLATPIFGFALTPPAPLAAPPATLVAQVADMSADEAEESVVEEAAADTTAEAPALSDDEYRAQVRERARLSKLHRALGLASWGATLVSVVAGVVQYRNLYGGFADQGSNPCVEGTAWLGQDQCSGTPWFHLLPSVAAGALYWTTFAYSLIMPDPDNASEGNSQYAKNVRMHKLLRWIHVGGMAMQTVVGAFIANPHLIGMDRANDYGTLQALSTVHLGVGLVTFAALTWAGYLFTF